MSIELRFIRHALALGQHGNYARAAKSIGLTQPALSRSIATLESQLGVQLFDRTNRGVEPTAFGRLLIERGERLLDGASELRRELVLLKGLDIGELTIAAGPHIGELVLGEAAGLLLADHPRLRLRLSFADFRVVGQRILRGEADVGLAHAGAWSNEPEIVVEPIATHRIVVGGRTGHPLDAVRDVTPQQILAFPFASTPIPGPLARHLDASLHGLTRDALTGDAHPSVEFDSVALAEDIVVRSDAVFAGPLPLFASGLRADRLTLFDLRLPWLESSYGLVTRAGRTKSPAAEAFATNARQVAREKMAIEAEIVREHRLDAPKRAGRRKRAVRRKAG
jgi:DNA-binding transcriptional LysR family regulator